MGQLLSNIQKILKSFLLILMLLGFNPETSYSQPLWFSKLRQIKILITTRQKIEKLFNSPKIDNTYESKTGQIVEYRIDGGVLSIVYSQGKCRNDHSFNIEADIITDLDFKLEKEVKISKLNLDIVNYDKEEIDDLPGIFNYINETSGEYYTETNETIREIWYFPTKEQQKLRCQSNEIKSSY